MIKCLKIAHVNIRSLSPKFSTVREIILLNNYDIFALSETWLNCGVGDAGLVIDGYKFIHTDRGSRGGGVGAYVRNCFDCEMIGCSVEIEQLWFSFKIKNKSLTLGVVYRPPHQDYNFFLDQLEDSFITYACTSDMLICLGDLNIDLLKSSPASSSLLLLLESLSLEQVVAEPTRLTSLLDLIIVSDDSAVSSTKVCEYDFSDHDLIECTINLEFHVTDIPAKFCRDMNKINIGDFTGCLEALPLQHIYTMHSVDDKVDFFGASLLKLFDYFAPIKTARFTRPPAPWITDNIKLLMSLRDKAKRKYKQTRQPASLEYYRLLRNYTNSAIIREKRAYFDFIARGCTGAALWNKLRSLNITTSSKRNIPPHLTSAEEINNFFIGSIPRVDCANDIFDYYAGARHNVGRAFNFMPVDVSVVSAIIANISTSSVGSDGLSMRMLGMCCPLVLPYVTHIINSCLTEGVFPSNWKHALITPIAKTRVPESYGDLRPISILPILSKILERVMAKQINDYLLNHNLLPAIQSGFRRGHSCCTALLKVSDDILEACDKKLITVLILLDYSKAFDTIDHQLLCHILGYIGFADGSINLIHSYLSNRSQSVKIGNEISTGAAVLRGVPQGSVLGPILFAIYTCAFYKCVDHCSMHMYADDIQLYHSFSASECDAALDHINSDLRRIHDFSSKHALNLNPLKTKVLVFGNEMLVDRIKSKIHILVNNVPIPICDSAINLGVMMDSTFRYRTHVTTCVSRAYMGLKRLFPHRHALNARTKAMLCESLVLSQFTYCVPLIYNSLDVVTQNRIQKVQNACMRYIYGIRKFERITYRLKELNWLNMKNRRFLYTASMFHKIVTEKQPSYLFEKITFRTDVHNINVRFKGLLTPPTHRTSLYERSFSYNIVKIYNSLPGALKGLSPYRFTRGLRDILLTEQ